MSKRSFKTYPAMSGSLRSALILTGGIGFLMFVTGASAQINRSRPPSPPASSGSGGARSGGSSSYSGSRGGGSGNISSPRSDRGRIPDSSSSSAGSARSGSSSLDRYNKTQESSAASTSSKSVKHYQYYYPFGYYPYGYDPGGYYGGGYFPGSYYPDSYPYPYPTYPSYPNPRDRGTAIAKYDSPYYYCEDMASGQYINGSAVMLTKPKKIYTPTPEYRDGMIHGWRDLGADDYIAERNAENGEYRIRDGQADDPELDAALQDIKESWLKSDVEPLAAHVRRETPIAVMLRGKYQYTLEAGDFLEVTRAAYGSSSNLRFTLDHLHRKADGVYVLTGRHFFTDSLGHERAVYISYALAKVKDLYFVTQIAAAPDKE